MPLPYGFQCSVYDGDIPPVIVSSLERIYQSPFTTMPYFELFRHAHHPTALVISNEAANPVHILMYTVTGREVTLLNELVTIEQQYLTYFGEFIFSRYPCVTTVNFNCIQGRLDHVPYPQYQWKHSQDIAISLPSSPEAYNGQLGIRTRKHLKYYINRLHKEFTNVVFSISTTDSIEHSAIGTIIEMNRQRMKSKYIRSGYTAEFEGNIRAFCHHYGLVSTLSIQGKVVAGTISYLVGDHQYLEVISHDPAFNRFNVGQICLYHTINHAIETGRAAFHMLWGENEYKYRFRGVKTELFFSSVYRSNFYKLLRFPRRLAHYFSYLVNQAHYLTTKYILNLRKPAL